MEPLYSKCEETLRERTEDWQPIHMHVALDPCRLVSAYFKHIFPPTVIDKLLAKVPDAVPITFGKADNKDPSKNTRSFYPLPRRDVEEHILMPQDLVNRLNSLFQTDDLVCFRAGVFVDPVSSSPQHEHEDLPTDALRRSRHERVRDLDFPLVNVMIQVEGDPDISTLIRTRGAYHVVASGVETGDMLVFDGMVSHYGVGNNSHVERRLIHLTFAPFFLLRNPTGRAQIRLYYNNELPLDKKGTYCEPWVGRLFRKS